MRVGGFQGAGPAARTWVRQRAPTPSAASARWGPQHVALSCARASSARPRGKVPTGARGRWLPPVCARVRARDWGFLLSEVVPAAVGWSQQSPTPRLRDPGRCSPSSARGPVRASGGRAKPARLTCQGGSRRQGAGAAGPEDKGGNFGLSLDCRRAHTVTSQAVYLLEVPVTSRWCDHTYVGRAQL